jgi:hypothetical protein
MKFPHSSRGFLPLALGIALVLAGRGTVTPAQDGLLEMLELRELRIVDAGGRTVLMAGTDASGAGFVELANASGVPVAFLGTASAGGALDLLNEHGQRVLFAGVGPEGDGGVRTENVDGTRAFFLGDDVRGNGRVPESAQAGARVTH